MNISVDYELTQPPDKVWRVLTEPKLLAAWLMENDIEPTVGHEFNFRAQPMGNWDGVVHCKVLVVETHRLLRYSWKGSDLDSVVTWTLTPTPTGTKLHLEHEGFQEHNKLAYEMMGKGWRGHLAERIAKVLDAVD